MAEVASYFSSFFLKQKFGQTYDFKIGTHNSSHLHKVVIKCGSYSLTFNKVKAGVETEYAIPMEWANELPNSTSTSVSGTMTLTTYQSNYSTVVGSSVVKTITFILDATSGMPNLSVAVTDADSSIPQKFGAFVQIKSRLKVAITATGQYGATIKSYNTTLNGATYSGATFTTAGLNYHGTYNLVTTVVDSRGKSTSKTETITILPYSYPQITSFVATRADSTGNKTTAGLYLSAKVNFTISEVNGDNNRWYKVEYKAKSATSWNTLVSGSVYTLNDDLASSTEVLDAKTSYDVRLVVGDFFKEVTALANIGTVFKLIHYNKNGKSLSFGKVCEKEEGVEFGIKAWFGNGESPNGAIDIPANTDLNDVLDEGFYCITTPSIVTSLSNMPYTDSATAMMIVFRGGNEGQRIQILLKNHKTSNEVFERHYYTNEWGNWVKKSNGYNAKLLWSGASLGGASEVINLSENISKQPSGIVLIFCEYVNGEAKNQAVNTVFIPKYYVTQKTGVGHNFMLCTPNFGYFAAKYFYLDDEKLRGYANNEIDGTGACGIIYTNSRFCLRYVIGV